MIENVNIQPIKGKRKEKKDLLSYRIVVKEPIHVTMPKSSHGGVWISLRITELVVVPVCTNPVSGIPLQ